MSIRVRLHTAALAVLIAVTFAGCGGGGGSTSSSAPNGGGGSSPPNGGGNPPQQVVEGIAPPSGVAVVTANNAN